MKEIVQDRLNKITDLSDRRVLKNILYDVYENVVDYNLDMYDRLEKRIYNEIEDPLDKFYIYLSVQEAKYVDPISDFLHPIIPKDIDEIVYDMDEINESLQNNTPMILATIYMKCDFLTLNAILSSNQTYKGFVKTDKDVHEIEVKLKKSDKYLQEVIKLYKIFQTNSVAWNTINLGYINKFIDVVLKSTLTFKDGEKIVEVTIDLGEYEKYKRINLVALWNVLEIKAEDKSFPMPAVDRINFDHMISLLELGSQNGYMATLDNTDFLYTKRYDKDLVIVSSYSEQHSWNLIKIEHESNNIYGRTNFELLSNKKTLGFIGKFATLKSLIIRTKSELSRLLECYELKKELEFVDIAILDQYNKEIQTTDYNSFVDDNIRIDNSKKLMQIMFKPRDRDDYLILDKMSFLVSEIQILFPEYKCIGELV